MESGAYLHQRRYRIRHKLGQGGMGTVYLAEDTRLPGRLVALKENENSSQEAQMQFRREAVLLARLRHPNLPQVTDYFSEQNGLQYLVMDYVPGDTLQQVLSARRSPLPMPEALTAIEQVMQAVIYMHNWRDPDTDRPTPVIHRDIKPANIKRTPDNRIVLVDFGIAKVANTQATALGARSLTPGYAPLEQYNGGTDQRSDVYALGATLFSLLTARIPPASTDMAMGAPLPPPRTMNAGIPVVCERVITRAMQLQPGDRYQSVTEMYRALFDRPAAVPSLRHSRSFTAPLVLTALSGLLIIGGWLAFTNMPEINEASSVAVQASNMTAPPPTQVSVAVVAPSSTTSMIVTETATPSSTVLLALTVTPTTTPSPEPSPTIHSVATPSPTVTQTATATTTPSPKLSPTPLAMRIARPTTAPQMVYTVAPTGGDATTIQRAIDIAPAGATINVKPGIYRSGLDIRKEVTIVGIGNRDEIIIEATNTDAVYFDAARGRVENLTLRVVESEDTRYGIDIAGGELEVIGCDITSNASAIIGVHSGANPTVRNNRIHDGATGGIFVYDKGRGLYEDNEIYNNTLSGINVMTGADPIMRRNRIHTNQQHGVFIYDQGLGVFENNEIYANVRVGIAVSTGGAPTVNGNRIRSNRLEAIWVYDGGEGVFLNNTLIGNGGKGAFNIAEDVTIIQAGNITE